jgi:hypothetical protein
VKMLISRGMAPVAFDVMSGHGATTDLIHIVQKCCGCCRLDSVAAAVTGGSEDPLDNEEQVRWGCML